MTPVRRCSSVFLTSVAFLAALLAPHPVVHAQGGRGEHWVGTWATAVVARDPNPVLAEPAGPPRGQTVPQTAEQAAPARGAAAPQPPLNFKAQTLRQIVHVSLGGPRVRVVLSNVFGTTPLVVGGAHVALRDKGAGIVSASDRPLTFSGRQMMTIPAGASAVSDAVALNVPAVSDLAIDLYLPGDTGVGTSPLTMHTGAQQTNYVSTPGNHAGAVELPVMITTRSWFFLARVEVTAPPQSGAVVAIGDSITDGAASTPDRNARWPDELARRLIGENLNIGVLNVEIGGNRLLVDGNGVGALARFDRDVLMQSGITHLIVFEGINDIRRTTPPVTVAELIGAYQQLIARAHEAGLKTYGVILLPFEGSLWTPENEVKRQALSSWIRTSRMYDGVIDFDVVVRDPAHPTQLLPRYDSGDHIHPNDSGYQAMAQAINLELFRTSPSSRRPPVIY